MSGAIQIIHSIAVLSLRWNILIDAVTLTFNELFVAKGVGKSVRSARYEELSNQAREHTSYI